MNLLAAVLILAGVQLAQTDPGQMEEEKPIILNYWVHLNTVLNSDAARRDVKIFRPGQQYVPRKHYPFELLDHLRAEDLLRAAHEGIDAARTELWGKSPAEIEAQIYRNIAFALEYYPIRAQIERDVELLLMAMSDPKEEELLRVYLLTNAVPGEATPSSFGLFLQEAIRYNPTTAKPYLSAVATNPQEPVRVQIAALRAYTEVLRTEYNQVLAKDPALVEFAKQQGEALTPVTLLSPGAPQLSADLATMLRDYDAQLFEYARVLGDCFKGNTARPPEVQAVARACLERICREMPNSRQAEIQAVFDALPPAPPT